jgi:hypothetical protein
MDCVRGLSLLQYSRNPHHLRGFLELRADRLGQDSVLHKSIIVLRGQIGSDLQMTERTKGATWPMLRRTGQYPPSMLIPELGNIISVIPDEQRIGCDYIDHLQASHFIARAYLDALRLYLLLDTDNANGMRFDEMNFGELGQSLFTDIHPLLDVDQPLFAGQDLRQAAQRLTTIFFNSSRRNNYLNQIYFRQNLEAALNDSKLHKKIKDDLLEKSAANASGKASPGDALSDFKRAATLLHCDLKSGTHCEAAIMNMSKRARHSIFKHIVLQGCGDVSMNYWNICFLPKDDPPENRDRLIHVPGEPVDDREYSCLISWDAQMPAGSANELRRYSSCGKVFSAGANTPTLSIGRVRINQYGKTSQLRLVTGQEPLDIDEIVRYAVYGQRLAWDGHVVEPRSVAPEFSDVRHLLNLPNLNFDFKKPSGNEVAEVDTAWAKAHDDASNAGLGDLFRSETCPEAFREHPRYMFGVPATHDVWLGERVLLPTDSLLQAACEHPVEIELSQLGTPWDWITVCMIHWGYTLKRNRDEVIDRGDFAWDRIDPAKPRLIVFFLKALYPCTLVGIGKLLEKESPRTDNEPYGDLFLLAWGHGFNNDQGYTIFDCAKLLVDLGAKAVLLIDEGGDVFQHYFPSFTELQQYEEGSFNSGQAHQGIAENFPVVANREQMRSTLAFWVEP